MSVQQMLMHLKIESLKLMYSSLFHILKHVCIFIYVCIKICIQICMTGPFNDIPWPIHLHRAQLTAIFLLCSPESILYVNSHVVLAGRMGRDRNWNYKALTGSLDMPSLGKTLFAPTLPWSVVHVDTVLWWLSFESPFENPESIKGRRALQVVA